MQDHLLGFGSRPPELGAPKDPVGHHRAQRRGPRSLEKAPALRLYKHQHLRRLSGTVLEGVLGFCRTCEGNALKGPQSWRRASGR